MTNMRVEQTKRKSGINHPLVCKKCGHKVGHFRIKRKIKWKTIRWAIGLSFIFEFITNAIVYFIFN